MTKLKPSDIPESFAVRPLADHENPKGRATCGQCGLSWDDDIPTAWTPVPAARCPFEYFHKYEESNEGQPKFSEISESFDAYHVMESFEQVLTEAKKVEAIILKTAASQDRIEALTSCKRIIQVAKCHLPAQIRTPFDVRFHVQEHLSGFSLFDRRTGKSQWLSDGVDCVPHPDEEDEYLPPGGDLFCALWASQFNEDVTETLEAYWPDED